MRAITLFQEQPTDIPWSRPIEGVIAYVDLDRAARSCASPTTAATRSRRGSRTSARATWGPVRTSLRPLAITQPDGPSFRVDGYAVEWEGWSFRVGFDAREGLVLHQVGYADGGRVRPIIHRASISEMVVPYADPHPMRFWISYFDEGEYGLGRLATHADARLRLPRRDPLLRRRVRRRPGRAGRAAEGRVHARGGRRRAVEAPGLLQRHQRGAPRPGASSSRSGRRSATTTTASSGTCTRTARSSSTSSSPASCSPSPPATPPATTPRRSRRSWPRRTTSTCSTCAST